MDPIDLKKYVAEAILLEAEESRRAGKIGYMARALVQATLPHKATPGNIFKRQNGEYEMVVMSPKGLPYGSVPRLLLSWVTTEAVRTRSPFLVLGTSLAAFMTDLKLLRTGGKRGDITRVKMQTERLFTSSISCHYKDDESSQGGGFIIAKEYNLWWNPRNPKQLPLWKSSVTLSTDFFNEIIERPVPIDMAALFSLKRSPMALDIYFWLTYRLSYLRKDALIPWELLQLQFGANYGKDHRGQINFKRKFLLRLKDVMEIYDAAKVCETEHGLLLKPSPPHVAKRPVPEVTGSRQRLLPAAVAAADEAKEALAEGISTAFFPFSPVTIHLKTDTFEKAKEAAPSLDVYFLEQEWREWIGKKGELPRNPDNAFIGFCRRKAKKHNPY